MKDLIIQKIKDINIEKEFDWVSVVLGEITDKYARGYLTSKAGHLNNYLDHQSEQYRHEILACCDHDIWGK